MVSRYKPRKTKKLKRDEVKHFEGKIDTDPDMSRMRDQLVDGLGKRYQKHALEAGFVPAETNGLGKMGASELLVRLAIYIAQNRGDFDDWRGRDTRSRPTEREVRL